MISRPMRGAESWTSSFAFAVAHAKMLCAGWRISLASFWTNNSRYHTQRADWARRQRRIRRELPKARLWQRVAVALGDQVLDTLKAGLTDSKLPRPDIGEIAFWTSQIASWRRMADAELVDEYLWWAGHQPRLTAGMVYAANSHEIAEHQALRQYLRTVEPGATI